MRTPKPYKPPPANEDTKTMKPINYEMMEYQNALNKFAAKGNRYATIGSVTCRGYACGLTAEEIIADVHALGVTNRDAGIRRSYPSAQELVDKGEAKRRSHLSARRPQRPRKPHVDVCRVKDLIGIALKETSRIGYSLGTLTACALMKFIIERVWGEERQKPANQRIMGLWTLLRGDRDAYVEVREDKSHRRPYLGEGIRTSGYLLDAAARLKDIGELIGLNTLTGQPLPNANGRDSLVGRGCVASFRYMLMEFDDMTLKEQCLFWIGVLLTGELDVLMLTYSGKKSIHAVIEVNCKSLEEWNAVRDEIKRRFASGTDKRYHLDIQALTPEVATRLPGAYRKDTGLHQELLYLREAPTFPF